ncbi:hypothetical protein ILUMI_09893 [Ignelater luminosus]|uniref:Testin n=1 Tax=Ignelater luminosus TaxID=2038154 RepID=A0A8K0D3B6_IGNLU|nr:hypothetical protein ILUMI_09893 [Ignelater luminosus]
MIEEAQEGPKWLKELEEKREKRLKARLGHEAGAGSPCLTCEEKCPGLDLHFWRKICKNCKCGKENHDVNDDDIYGWAQFQLLGSKPNKSKKIVLPGRKDAVELEWTPKGQNDVVETYLKDLPVNLLPIKGSAAAQERKQLLQKQIPLHDIDPTLCHALSENEVKQMNDYIAHVKQNSVGVGHIMKLNELLKNRCSAANAQILSSRAPMQVPQLQNIILQGVDRTGTLKINQPQGGDLHNKSLRDLSAEEQKLMNISRGEQVAANINNIKDVVYETYGQNRDGNNDFSVGENSNFIPLSRHSLKNVQVPQHNLKNMQLPMNPLANQIDYQNPTNLSGIKDIHYSDSTVNYPQYQAKLSNEEIPANFAHPHNIKNLPHFAATSLKNIENTQKPFDYSHIRDVYPDMNVNFDPNQIDVQVGDIEKCAEHLDNALSLKGDGNIPHYAPGKFNTFTEQQNPQKIGNIKDLAYSTYEPSLNSNLNNENLRGVKYPPHVPANYNPNEINVIEQNLNPTAVNVGIINDIEYPTIKSAVQRQNNIFEPEIPRKNVQFNLTPEEILPNCHRCKKMFAPTAIVIGTDRTDALWHAECFKCTGCNQNLADLMYFYHKESDDIYCGRDYAKIRGIPRCNACDELIFVKEYCLAENSTFHVKHFCCFECDEPLAGQNYVMEDSQPLCLPCFEKVKAEKCNACLTVIKPDEQGANLNGVHFHADDNCFACKICRKPLLGAKILFKNRNLYCSAPCFGADTKK